MTDIDLSPGGDLHSADPRRLSEVSVMIHDLSGNPSSRRSI